MFGAVLATIAVIVLGSAWGISLYLKYLFDNNVHRADLLPDRPSKSTNVNEPQNILLIGSDSRDLSLADSRSDVIQLVHISGGTPKISIIHFPRDLYVNIPGYNKNKINAAYAYGGSPLLVETLQNLLGIHIDHVAQIGFDGFAKVTDDIGGVDVYVRQAVTLPSMGALTKGTHHMSGKQALEFVRERHQLAEGDIDRGRDQQAWLRAVAQKVLQKRVLLNPAKTTSLVEDLAKSMTVDRDFSSDYLQSMAVRLRGLTLSDVRFFTAPFSGFAKDPVAGDIDVVDQKKMMALADALQNDAMEGYKEGQNSVS